jgi:hypothetical protein
MTVASAASVKRRAAVQLLMEHERLMASNTASATAQTLQSRLKEIVARHTRAAGACRAHRRGLALLRQHADHQHHQTPSLEDVEDSDVDGAATPNQPSRRVYTAGLHLNLEGLRAPDEYPPAAAAVSRTSATLRREVHSRSVSVVSHGASSSVDHEVRGVHPRHQQHARPLLQTVATSARKRDAEMSTSSTFAPASLSHRPTTHRASKESSPARATMFPHTQNWR